MSPLAWLLSFLDLEIVRGSHSVVCDLTKGKERKPWTILTLVLVMQYGDERDSWLRWGHTTLVGPGKSPAVGLFRSITVNKGYPPSQKPFYQWAVGQNITWCTVSVENQWRRPEDKDDRADQMGEDSIWAIPVHCCMPSAVSSPPDGNDRHLKPTAWRQNASDWMDFSTKMDDRFRTRRSINSPFGIPKMKVKNSRGCR